MRPDDDFYPTPAECTRALLSVESFAGGIWECCAGMGDMAVVLREAGYTVTATTLGDARYEKDMPKHRVVGGRNFLNEQLLLKPNIVTNPPYKLTDKILEKAFSLGAEKVAFLLNVKYLAGQDRYDAIHSKYPLKRVHVFSDRITMYPGFYKGKKNSSTETYAWFVWEKSGVGSSAPQIGWLNSRKFRLASVPALAMGAA